MAPSRFVAPKRLETLDEVRKALQQVQEQLDALSPDRRTDLQTKDLTLRAGEFVRISPRQGGTVRAKLPKAGPENFGQTVTIALERPNGTLRVSAQAPDTVNGVRATNFASETLITLQSNGVDAWVSVSALPSTSPGGAALEAEYLLAAADANLPNGIAPGTDREVPVAGGGTAAWQYPVEIRADGVDQGDAYAINFLNTRATVAAGVAEIDPKGQLTVVNPISGTQNAYAIPATVLHRDLIAWVSGGATVTLNGINATGVPSGFQFTLQLSANTFVDIVSESASAAANNRISLPSAKTLSLQSGAAITFHRYATRWGVLEIGFPDASASIVYSGNRILQRAALTGDVTAAQNSNATTIANNVVSNAKLRDSAARSVIGRSAATAGDPADIVAANDGEILGRSGGTVGFAAPAAFMGGVQSITGATTQDQVDSVVAAGVALGLWTDNR